MAKHLINDLVFLAHHKVYAGPRDDVELVPEVMGAQHLLREVHTLGRSNPEGNAGGVHLLHHLVNTGVDHCLKDPEGGGVATIERYRLIDKRLLDPEDAKRVPQRRANQTSQLVLVGTHAEFIEGGAK